MIPDRYEPWHSTISDEDWAEIWRIAKADRRAAMLELRRRYWHWIYVIRPQGAQPMFKPPTPWKPSGHEWELGSWNPPGDAGGRELERRAAAGDPAAMNALHYRRVREGSPPDYSDRAMKLLDALNDTSVDHGFPFLDHLDHTEQEEWRVTGDLKDDVRGRFLVLTTGVMMSWASLWPHSVQDEAELPDLIRRQLFLDDHELDPLPWYTRAVVDLLFMTPWNWRPCVETKRSGGEPGPAACGNWRVPHPAPNPDPRLRRLERRAAASGSPEDMETYGRALNRSGLCGKCGIDYSKPYPGVARKPTPGRAVEGGVILCEVCSALRELEEFGVRTTYTGYVSSPRPVESGYYTTASQSFAEFRARTGGAMPRKSFVRFRPTRFITTFTGFPLAAVRTYQRSGEVGGNPLFYWTAFDSWGRCWWGRGSGEGQVTNMRLYTFCRMPGKDYQELQPHDPDRPLYEVAAVRAAQAQWLAPRQQNPHRQIPRRPA